LSFLTSNRKRVDKARLDAIRPIRIDSHGNPCSLNDKARGRKIRKHYKNYCKIIEAMKYARQNGI
jgi:hypothetical protein